MGNYESAVGFFTNSIECINTEPAYFNNRASAYIQLKNTDAALNDSLQVIKLDINNVKGHMRIV